MAGNFEQFVSAHPVYEKCYRHLNASHRLLGMSARSVFQRYGEALGPVAHELLGFVEAHFPSDYLDRYLRRVAYLNQLQEKFDAAPSSGTLGDPTAAVDRLDYDVALLLSVPFTNHRFELFEAFKAFLGSLAPKGRLAAVGVGTGYELLLAARAIPGWLVEGYDTNPSVHERARLLLSHAGVSSDIVFRELFPLEAPGADQEGAYDALVACELLEHLPDPLGALRTFRRCLKPGAELFGTMAINMAQEDHVFLYPSVEACRAQVADAGLHITREWIIPMSVLPVAPNPANLRRGNYAFIARAA
ncbi:class I SAM-dependent methyltransferase [Archangium sp.]|uniref:class I SAM-dependent methyltransferase n=1 Tax=Archangium sp. TaxID=1872627 RepID=UPI00286C6D62|nr:class I SAM-dependent methyltransferase [Archangium sp.]